MSRTCDVDLMDRAKSDEELEVAETSSYRRIQISKSSSVPNPRRI